MTEVLSSYGTGDQQLDNAIAGLVAGAGSAANHDLLFEMVVTALRLGRETSDRGDLKLVNSALKELRHSMGVFAPYRDVPKLSVFGSARTARHDPNYDATVALGAAIAARGWMVISGAGPGIMTAAAEGAGPQNSFGVGIALPFEEKSAETIFEDPKLITFKYFFTRKLTFMKESHGFALLPGGFGTLDESFELLTLLQTGKTRPAPVVLLDTPGGDYWHGWKDFVTHQLLHDHLISADDLGFVRITDSVDEAVEELCGFYRNFHSVRYVGRRLVIRLQHAPTAALIEDLNADFGDIVAAGEIALAPVSASEARDQDRVELHRIAFEFDRRQHARLRQLIDRVNDDGPAE